MADLPKLDPVKLYNRSLDQIKELSNQTLQMGEMIDALSEELEKVTKERDEAKFELSSLVIDEDTSVNKK
jgi:hypothetical protein